MKLNVIINNFKNKNKKWINKYKYKFIEYKYKI